MISLWAGTDLGFRGRLQNIDGLPGPTAAVGTGCDGQV